MLRIGRLVTGILVIATVSACGGAEMEPGDEAHNNRENLDGAGLFSGPSGEFVIFRKDEPATPAEPSEERATQ